MNTEPTIYNYLLALALVIATSLGCSNPDAAEPAADSDAVEAPAAGLQTKSEKAEGPTSPADNEENSEASEDTEASEPQAYKPPFPERVDLFVPPQRGRKVAANNRKEGAVEFHGISNVDEPKALLSIDGVLYPVAEGESKLDVKVVSIKPPAVVLQRGGQVWQASHEN